MMVGPYAKSSELPDSHRIAKKISHKNVNTRKHMMAHKSAFNSIGPQTRKERSKNMCPYIDQRRGNFNYQKNIYSG